MLLIFSFYLLLCEKEISNITTKYSIFKIKENLVKECLVFNSNVVLIQFMTNFSEKAFNLELTKLSIERVNPGEARSLGHYQNIIAVENETQIYKCNRTLDASQGRPRGSK